MKLSNMIMARLAGFCYFCVAATGFFAHFAREKLVIPGDAAATMNNVLSHPLIYTTSIVSDVVMTAFWITTAAMLYALFCRHSHKLAGRLMIAFVVTGSAVVLGNDLFYVAAGKLADRAGDLVSFPVNQRQMLVHFLLDVGGRGVMVASFFFGLWLFPLSYLVWRSGAFPRWAGRLMAVLLIIAGLGYLADFFLAFLLPGMTIVRAQNTFWGELFLLLWLLIRGCRDVSSLGTARHARPGESVRS